jgi:hypothetical protein
MPFRHPPCPDKVDRIPRTKPIGKGYPPGPRPFLRARLLNGDEFMGFTVRIVTPVEPYRISCFRSRRSSGDQGPAGIPGAPDLADYSKGYTGSPVLFRIKPVYPSGRRIPGRDQVKAGFFPGIIVPEQVESLANSGFPIPFQVINDPPVSGNYHPHIFGAFHAALNLEGIHPGIGQGRYVPKEFQIRRAEVITSGTAAG